MAVIISHYENRMAIRKNSIIRGSKEPFMVCNFQAVIVAKVLEIIAGKGFSVGGMHYCDQG